MGFSDRALRAAQRKELEDERQRRRARIDEANAGKNRVADLWVQWSLASKQYLAQQEKAGFADACVVRVFRRRPVLPRRKLAAWPLWTGTSDFDSPRQPTIHYIVADGGLAAGSDPDAVDLIKPGSDYDAFPWFADSLQRSVSELQAKIR